MTKHLILFARGESHWKAFKDHSIKQEEEGEEKKTNNKTKQKQKTHTTHNAQHLPGEDVIDWRSAKSHPQRTRPV
jgi:hypothetical protein